MPAASLSALGLSSLACVKGDLSAEVVGSSHLRSRGGLGAVNLALRALGARQGPDRLRECWPTVSHLSGLDSLECDLAQVQLPRQVRKVSLTDYGFVTGAQEMRSNFRKRWGASVQVVLDRPWKRSLASSACGSVGGALGAVVGALCAGSHRTTRLRSSA